MKLKMKLVFSTKALDSSGFYVKLLSQQGLVWDLQCAEEFISEKTISP